MNVQLNIKTPQWCLPLLGQSSRYKFARGGRGSGKSHFFAERVVEEMVVDPECKVVCIREIQKSMKFSSYALIKQKIYDLGVAHLFDITLTEIRRIGGDGICIFQGMQDHTADSIKSLEGFKIAWIEEAQRLSAYSLKLLRPTIIIRRYDSEIWASWNPNQSTDAIEVFSKTMEDAGKAVCVHVNYPDNPFLTSEALEEIDSDRRLFPDDFDHVYLGAFDERSESRVFSSYEEDFIEPDENTEFYYGSDWGFSQDPTTLLRCWLSDDETTIYVDYQIDGVGVEIDDTPEFFRNVPLSDKHTIRADSARPETNSYMNRHGYMVEGVKKGAGSVEDGITWLKSKKIIFHPRCKLLAKELRLYSYKTNKAGDILPIIEDKNNHCIDALRYAFEPLIRDSGSWFM